jgi:hypothetical protein
MLSVHALSCCACAWQPAPTFASPPLSACKSTPTRTTDISSHDIYFADLTDVLVRKKRLPLPSTDWVLCLADFSLALPLDRTVASLQGKTDLALVKRQWAVEHGLKVADRRGGDPSGKPLLKHR